MIQPAFDIGNGHEGRENCSLLMEVSETFFNYIIYNNEPKQLFHVRQYTLEPSADKGIYDILEEIRTGDPLLQQPMKQTAILYNFPESNLLPEEHFDMSLNKSVTQLIYGDVRKGLILSEKVDGWAMYNVYRVPKDVHAFFQQNFDAGKYWHFYTMMMSSLKNEDQPEGHLIRIVFYNDKFIAGFFSGGQLQLLQTFTYQTPEDAAYYLLLMCKQFQVAQHEAALSISGLIDGKSSLFTELLKYFPEVSYEAAPASFDTNGILDEYPSHYFSPLMKMSLCV